VSISQNKRPTPKPCWQCSCLRTPLREMYAQDCTSQSLREPAASGKKLDGTRARAPVRGANRSAGWPVVARCVAPQSFADARHARRRSAPLTSDYRRRHWARRAHAVSGGAPLTQRTGSHKCIYYHLLHCTCRDIRVRGGRWCGEGPGIRRAGGLAHHDRCRSTVEVALLRGPERHTRSQGRPTGEVARRGGYAVPA